ncbi:uncharacterized protein DUF3117 [Rhodococcus sp. OK302]|jgi:hypothetical protein|nr:uncharacterized protein DUF3117 [Rhodococcus sp. OK302]
MEATSLADRWRGTPFVDAQCSAAQIWREQRMAAMKPRTGDGPLEATKEGRGIVMRVPLEGGGRLVVELTPDEAAALGVELTNVTS